MRSAARVVYTMPCCLACKSDSKSSSLPLHRQCPARTSAGSGTGSSSGPSTARLTAYQRRSDPTCSLRPHPIHMPTMRWPCWRRTWARARTVPRPGSEWLSLPRTVWRLSQVERSGSDTALSYIHRTRSWSMLRDPAGVKPTRQLARRSGSSIGCQKEGWRKGRANVCTGLEAYKSRRLAHEHNAKR